MDTRKAVSIMLIAMLTACSGMPEAAPDSAAASASVQETEDHHTITAPTLSENITTETDEETSAADALQMTALSDEAEDAAAVSAVITLSDSGIQIDGTGAQADGSTLIIHSGGIYEISGTLTGQIIVECDKSEEAELVLCGVTVNGVDKLGSPLCVKSADKVTLRLKKGTVNTFTDTSVYASSGEDDPDACIYSCDDLTVKGSGTLTVVGSFKHGIHSTDDIKIKNGIISVTSASDGIKGKDGVVIEGGDVSVVSGGDGIVSTSADEGRGYVEISGGSVNITSGGGSAQSSASHEQGFGFFEQSSDYDDADGISSKGIKAEQDIIIKGGTVRIDSADDGLHSDGNVTVTDGTLTISAGDDAVHADKTLTISGGTGDITRAYEGLEGAVILMSGGTWTVNADDDGINAGDGTGDRMGMFGRGFDGGQFPDRGERPQQGDMPPMGELPDMGELPGMANISDTADMTDTAAQTSQNDIYIEISGGEYHINAGGDGIDSNGDITMTGGTVTVDGPTDDRNAALDFAGSFSVSGGRLLSAGSSGMAQGLTSVTGQSAVSVYFSSQQSGGTEIALTSADGSTVISYSPAKTFSFITFTSPELTDGTYTLSANGEKLCDITVSGITSVNDKGEAVSGNMGGFGGFGGRGGRDGFGGRMNR